MDARVHRYIHGLVLAADGGIVSLTRAVLARPYSLHWQGLMNAMIMRRKLTPDEIDGLLDVLEDQPDERRNMRQLNNIIGLLWQMESLQLTDAQRARFTALMQGTVTFGMAPALAQEPAMGGYRADYGPVRDHMWHAYLAIASSTPDWKLENLAYRQVEAYLNYFPEYADKLEAVSKDADNYPGLKAERVERMLKMARHNNAKRWDIPALEHKFETAVSDKRRLEIWRELRVTVQQDEAMLSWVINRLQQLDGAELQAGLAALPSLSRFAPERAVAAYVTHAMRLPAETFAGMITRLNDFAGVMPGEKLRQARRAMLQAAYDAGVTPDDPLLLNMLFDDPGTDTLLIDLIRRHYTAFDARYRAKLANLPDPRNMSLTEFKLLRDATDHDTMRKIANELALGQNLWGVSAAFDQAMLPMMQYHPQDVGRILLRAMRGGHMNVDTLAETALIGAETMPCEMLVFVYSGMAERDDTVPGIREKLGQMKGLSAKPLKIAQQYSLWRKFSGQDAALQPELVAELSKLAIEAPQSVEGRIARHNLYMLGLLGAEIATETQPQYLDTPGKVPGVCE